MHFAGSSFRWRVCRIATIAFFGLAASATCATNALAVCGDGVLEASAEQCDDGNDVGGDCCAADCQYEPASAPCNGGDFCLAAAGAACDGQGTCTLLSPCSGDGGIDLFDPGTPEKQKITMRVRTPRATADDLAILGDPSAGTQYTICVYLLASDPFPYPGKLVYELMLPVGAGWERVDKGFSYRRPEGDPTPVERASVRIGKAHRSFASRRTARLVARGAALALPGAASSTEYFDTRSHALDTTSFCLLNDAGFATGIYASLTDNGPTRVHWDWIGRD